MYVTLISFMKLGDSQPYWQNTTFSSFIAQWKHTCWQIKMHVLTKLFLFIYEMYWTTESPSPDTNKDKWLYILDNYSK